MTPLARVLLVAGLSGAAACGFDGRATRDTGATVGADAAPAPTTTPSNPGPNDSGLPPVDGGSDTSLPVVTCEDRVLSFDGVDDAVTVPDSSDLDLKNDFTVEAWIKPGPTAVDVDEMDIVSHHDADNSKGWALLVRAGRVELVVFGVDGLGGKGYSAGNAGPTYVVPDKWAHVAGTLAGSTLRIYYDGILRDSQELGTFFGRRTFTGALRFGRSAAAADLPYAGLLDDVRLSKEARYTGPVAPKPTAALPADPKTVAAWRFDEPSGSVLIDAANKSHDGSIAPDVTAATRVSAPCINAR